MSIRRAALWSMASQYTSFLIQFATSVIVSRFYLLPADVGLFSVALAAAMMVSIFQDMGFSRFVTGQPQMRMEHVRDYAAVAVGAGTMVAVILLALAYPMASFYAEPRLPGQIAIIALAFLVQSLATLPIALLTRDLDFRALFQVNAGGAFAGAAATIALAARGFGPSSLAWGMLVTGLVKVCAALAYRPVLPRRIRALANIRPLISFSSSSFLISLSGSIGQRSQDLIIGRVLGMAATGLFTRASGLAGQMSTLMVGAINGVFYPAFARKRDASEPLGEPYLHLIACNTALNWAAALGLALAARPVIDLLYGENWLAVAPLLFWTALAEIFFVAVPLQMDIPILLGRIRILVWINFLDTALTIALLAIFAFWGLEAAAISRLVVAALWFAIYITYIARLLGIRFGQLVNVYAQSAIVALAACLPLACALHHEWFGETMGIVPLGVLSLAGVGTWLMTLFAIRHPARLEVKMGFDRLFGGIRRHLAA